VSVHGEAPPMIGEPLPILAFGAVPVDLPRLAQLAPGAGVARAVTFMMHGTQPFSPPAAGEAGRLGASSEFGKQGMGITKLSGCSFSDIKASLGSRQSPQRGRFLGGV